MYHVIPERIHGKYEEKERSMNNQAAKQNKKKSKLLLFLVSQLKYLALQNI